jgi:hypothetical protein
MKKIMFGAAALVLALAVTGGARAQQSRRSERLNAQERQAGSGGAAPVKGRLSGKVNLARDGKALIFDTTASAAGNLSALGRVEANCSVPDVRVDRTNLRLGLGVTKGTGTIKTAGGDKIFGRFSFPGASVGFSPKGDISTKVELQVTGGTGKYEGATGRAVGTGRGNVFTRTFVIDLDGGVVLRRKKAS